MKKTNKFSAEVCERAVRIVRAVAPGDALEIHLPR